MGELRLGIAGVGAMGRLHADVIRQSTECRLDAIADPSPQARDFAAERGASYFPDLAEMLDAKPLDGVIVASPNVAHSSHAIVCMQRALRGGCVAERNWA